MEYDINPDALECKVPKMILQPVVENAIYHGLEPTSRKGNLILKCTIEPGGELVISVKDNGVGIEPVKLDSLRSELAAFGRMEWVQGVSSIGIVNVSNRLKLIYGEKYGIDIISGVNEGTGVTFRIPARR
jgi:two-component system sensor histidine kinase YesM